MTCWRHLKEWQEAGVWERLHRVLLDRLGEADQIDWERASLDSASIPAKRGPKTGANPTNKGKKGTKRHLVSDRRGIPLAVVLTAANVHDSMAFEELIDAVEPIKRPRGRPRRRPEKLHADKAYDDKKCKGTLRRGGIMSRIARKAATVDLAAADPAVLESAVAGADAVLSCLGPRSAYEMGIAFQETRAIVRAMQATDVRHLVVVSAAPVSTVPSPGRPKPPRHDPGDGFFMRHLGAPLLKAALRGRYADLALMEDIVRESGLDWTIVRPVQLIDKPLSGNYRTAYGQNVRRGLRISRADVAHLMLRVLEQPDSIRQSLAIAY